MGQFFPVFLQLAGLSAANETVHIAAIKIEKRTFGYVFISPFSIADRGQTSEK